MKELLYKQMFTLYLTILALRRQLYFLLVLLYFWRFKTFFKIL